MKDRKESLDQLCINTIRMLAVDMIEKARSGHPGLPLGAAETAYVLWSRVLRHNPANPLWPDRDRFILSAGHGSALLYALLHLFGYPLPMEELKQFRQWGSKAPGHPEYGLTPGAEVTSGPLGQGFAMGVGMAVAERFLARKVNRPGFPVVDHCIYALVSDGDLMEGVASEAASLAGTLGLGKLIYLFDDNHITIDGDTSLTFREDAGRRFEAYGWHVQRLGDDAGLDRIEEALRLARQEQTRPSLIMVRTHIGYGSPKQDSPKCHGEPLGAEALRATKEKLGWPQDPPFLVPAEAAAHCRQYRDQGAALEKQWSEMLERYRQAFPAEAEALGRDLLGELPAGWDRSLPVFRPEEGPLATRGASGKVINALAGVLTNLTGGSADLAGSVQTLIKGHDDRNIHFGIREHAMAAMVNGMVLHGGLIPYCGTFLVFADYMRPAIRLAAVMNIRSLFIFSHDSIGVGEDGPTHQPVEQLASLRCIPNLRVMRPADANETVAAWRVALSKPGPTALILTRQKVPILDPAEVAADGGLARGAYVLADCAGLPQILLLATGSEVHLVLAARKALQEQGVAVRVVSMPCWELFSEQTPAYRESVLPSGCRLRLALEAGAAMGWHQWVGDRGEVMSVDRFGVSAPGEVVMEKFGFSVERVLEKARALLGGA